MMNETVYDIVTEDEMSWELIVNHEDYYRVSANKYFVKVEITNPNYNCPAGNTNLTWASIPAGYRPSARTWNELADTTIKMAINSDGTFILRNERTSSYSTSLYTVFLYPKS